MLRIEKPIHDSWDCLAIAVAKGCKHLSDTGVSMPCTIEWLLGKAECCCSNQDSQGTCLVGHPVLAIGVDANAGVRPARPSHVQAEEKYSDEG